MFGRNEIMSILQLKKQVQKVVFISRAIKTILKQRQDFMVKGMQNNCLCFVNSDLIQIQKKKHILLTHAQSLKKICDSRIFVVVEVLPMIFSIVDIADKNPNDSVCPF